MMQIEERPSDDVMILDLKGKLTIGEGDELLKDKINSLIQQGHRKLITVFDTYKSAQEALNSFSG